MTPAILVWRFQDAPQHLKELSDNGGDEDWIVLVPMSVEEEVLKNGMPAWIQAMGSCDVSEYTLADGTKVFIGSHS